MSVIEFHNLYSRSALSLGTSNAKSTDAVQANST